MKLHELRNELNNLALNNPHLDECEVLMLVNAVAWRIPDVFYLPHAEPAPVVYIGDDPR